MNSGRVIALGAVALLLWAPAARAEITVHLAPDAATRFIHEPFALRLEVESDAPPETPDLPVVPDLAVVTVRRLPSDPSRGRHAFEIRLIAERDGVLALPPFAVRAGGESTSTPPLRLRIRAPRPAAEMSLTIEVEPTALRVGQPATVKVTWTSAVPFVRCKQLLLEIPLIADERFRIFPLDPSDPEVETIGLPVNNQRMVAQTGISPDGRPSLSFRYKVVPREPCVLRAQDARLACALRESEAPSDEPPGHFYNQFFVAPDEHEAYERIYLAARTPEIAVRALEEAGRSGNFAYIVGSCNIRASVAPTRLVVGQPALLTVHLDSLDFARHITALPATAFDGLRSEFRISAEPIRETVADSARSFTHVLRPLHPGIACIPAIVIQVFNPHTGDYQTLRSAPIPVAVEPDVGEGARTVVPRLDSRPPIPLNGVRHNRASGETLMSARDILEFLGRHWWAFVPLPPLLWLALLPLARRWERCRRDPIYARATAAPRRFRQEARHGEEAAWRNFLADRLALHAEALTADTVAEALRARKVDSGLVAEARRRFDERDATDYGKRPAPPSRSTRSLVRRIERATVPLLLAGCLLVPIRGRGSAPETADELFSRALRMRGEKPDEAQPLFVEAALRFESAGRLLNAGNSWFFAGESGRALVNYRAAERGWPFDRQLRESIEFVRANRADAFPPPATPSGRLAAFWMRFCTWGAVMRTGLFVLAYLAAWMIFVTAQLAGWRVRRSVWIVLGAAVLVPLVSLVQSSFRPDEGVVIGDAIARLGPGYAYDPAFQQPLHRATEFLWMEARQGWVRARLPDTSEGWLRESDCLKVE